MAGWPTYDGGISVDLSMPCPGAIPDEATAVCYNGWQQPVEVNWKGHRFAVVTHRCKKKLLHTTDHECQCGTVWTKG